MSMQIEIIRDIYNLNGFNLVIGLPILNSTAFYKQVYNQFVTSGDLIKWEDIPGLQEEQRTALILRIQEELNKRGLLYCVWYDDLGIKIN